MMKRLMVPFFVALLLGSLLMVPFPVAAAEPVPELIVGNPLVEAPPPDWPGFWAKFNQVSDWDLEYYDGAQWISEKSDLQVVRDYPEPNHVKLTLKFTSSHAANYRLTFAIDERVRDYVTKLDQYRYELNYENYSVIWDWSDAIAIPGLVFSHGLQDEVFWFRMRRDNVPLGAHVEIDPSVIASYPTTNRDDYIGLDDTHPSAGGISSAGQSFTSPAWYTVITSVKFHLQTPGAPDGDLIAQLFAHSGVYGTSSIPNGAALATSDAIAANTLTAGYVLYDFTFTGAQQYNMTPNTQYCIMVYRTATASSVSVGTDQTAPSHSGNAFMYNSGAWAAVATEDTIFYVYGYSPPTNDACISTAEFTRVTDGWVNITVSDADLVADLTTVDMRVDTNGTGTLENFTLRWTQATGVFSEVSDPSGVCTLNVAGSVRVNVDTDTDQLCFLFSITGATEGPCDVTVTSTDDQGYIDTDVYANEFTYIYWNEVADLIDDAFGFFGILDYMDQASTFINSISAQFVDSLIQLAVMINLQFQVIWQIWGWSTGWFTRMITAVLNLGVQLQMILNGTHPLIAGGVDLWNYFGFAGAGGAVFDVAPLFLIVCWINSMGKRARTQGTMTVLYGDLSAFANVFAYFMGAFSAVIGYIEGKISWLISALT